MKKLSVAIKYVLPAIGVVSSGIILSCAAHLHKAADTDKVTIEEDLILIPGTEISQVDQKAMNDILKHFHKYLYRIRTYENGKLIKEQGGLSAKIIGEATVSRVAENAKLHGLTGLTTQVGFGRRINPHFPTASARAESSVETGTRINASPSPTASARAESDVETGTRINASPSPTASMRAESGVKIGTHVSNPTDEETAESKELVRRLKPILEKYSR
jgi:hypothetical protein